jgi:hypothetical protein
MMMGMAMMEVGEAAEEVAEAVAEGMDDLVVEVVVIGREEEEVVVMEETDGNASYAYRLYDSNVFFFYVKTFYTTA